MCVKLPLRDLNPGHYLPHPTNIYTCRVTTAPRKSDGASNWFCVLRPNLILEKTS